MANSDKNSPWEEILYAFSIGGRGGAGADKETPRDNRISIDDIKRVIINYPATIILWNDGTKTVVKCSADDKYHVDTGIALCIMKKMFGNSSNKMDKWFNEVIDENWARMSFKAWKERER